MKKQRLTMIAGRTVMRKIVSGSRKHEKGEKRNKRMNPTRKSVQDNNFRIAVWNLCGIMNHNFIPGDWHLTLTYRGPEPDKQRAKKDLDKLLRDLRTHHKTNGSTLKWVAATEYENKRIHHHLVCSRTDLEFLEQHWPHGWVTAKPLDKTGNYYKLAEYLVKVTDKTFREDDSPTKRRYRSSRNMIRPETRREEVSDYELRNGPREKAGYYIDWDTVHTYEHAILGEECMQYILIALQPETPKSRKRGKKVPAEREYKVPGERQLIFDELICNGYNEEGNI